MSALGLRPEDFAAQSPEGGLYYDAARKAWCFDVWPDNWPPLELFIDLSTQWRVGPNGLIGLDYGVVFHELDRRKLAGDEYDDMMDGIRTIERAVLSELRRDEK